MLLKNQIARHAGTVSALVAMIGLAFAGAAQAAPGDRQYLVSGGGAQLQIGGGLPLPVQVVGTWTGAVAPPLLIPVDGLQIVQQTDATTSKRKLRVPAGILKKSAVANSVGLFPSNSSLFAARTEVAYSWPAASATFSSAARTGGFGPV